MGHAFEWAIGFAVFVAVTIATQLVGDWLIDAWWRSDGLDPTSRPDNPFIGWVFGLVAAAITVKLVGKE